MSLTLLDAERITGRLIKTRHNGYRSIEWKSEKHTMKICEVDLLGDGNKSLAVFGEPERWVFGSEVRKGRPKQITVYKVTERYLKSLAI